MNMITTQGRHKVSGDEFRCRPLPDAEQEARIANAEREETERQVEMRKRLYWHAFCDGGMFVVAVITAALLLSGHLS